jgi:predicted PurR-regulated permease PerM
LKYIGAAILNTAKLGQLIFGAWRFQFTSAMKCCQLQMNERLTVLIVSYKVVPACGSSKGKFPSMLNKRVTLIFLLTLTAISLYLSYLLFRPFLSPMLSALVIGIVFFPVHSRMQRLIGSPSLAALLSTLLVMLIIIIPAVLIVLAVIQEVSGLKSLIDQKSIESGSFSLLVNQLLDRPLQWVSQYVNISQFNIFEALRSRLDDLSSFLLNEMGVILGSVTSFAVNTVITIFTLFFIFREGKSMRRRVAAVAPLTPGQVEKLFNGVENTIIGTVYGGLVVAAVQGMMVGAALWLFKIPSPVLWGAVAAFFALLPLVGTAAVWLPAAIYLLATGHYVQAIILIGWGAGVVGTVDNILRPYLISGRVQMHTLLIFFAVFGGVTVFGFLGLFIGPVILAVTITLLGMLRDETRYWNASFRDEYPAPALEGSGLVKTEEDVSVSQLPQPAKSSILKSKE